MDLHKGFSASFDENLGRTIRLISHFDWKLSQVALFLVQGKGWQNHMESWYYAGSFGKYIGVSGRINLIHDLMLEFGANSTGEHQVPEWYKDLERDLRQVNARRNRIAHDAWVDDMLPDRKPLLIPLEHPANAKWEEGEWVTEEDLKAFSDFVESVIEKLESLWNRPDVIDWIGKSPKENG